MSDAETILLTSWENEEIHDEAYGATVIKLSAGDPHQRALFYAVRDRWNALTGRNRPTAEDLEALRDQKVTIVRHGENMLGGEMLKAIEGTILMHDGKVAMIPKRGRTKGHYVPVDKVLAVYPGYCAKDVQATANAVRETFPKLQRLTQERLNAMPEVMPEGGLLTLCVFGSYRMPDGVASDALVLMGEYDAENDIVDGGVVLLRPEHGVSEHGSVYGRYLLSWDMGEVLNYEPITFARALELCDLPFDRAFDVVMHRVHRNAAETVEV